MDNLDKVIENGHKRGLLIRSKMLDKIIARIYYAICPKCNTSFSFDGEERPMKVTLTCPNCGKSFKVNIS